MNDSASSNNVYKIALLPGDGIGPEVMAEALKVLEAVGKTFGFSCDFREGYIGGAALDKHDTPFPSETRDLCHAVDAVLLGSIGGPRWDHLPPRQRPELGGLLALRKSLRLYANIRPVRLFEALRERAPLAQDRIPSGIDLVTVRELAGGVYFGEPKRLEEERGMDTMTYTKQEVERIAPVAFEIAAKRRKRVTSVDKANVLYSSMLWRKVVAEVAGRYPDIRLEHMYVDNAAMQLILDPGRFDVILTTNLFGDILTDESAALCGSLGMLPSASFGEVVHLYEPAGGSAPDIAGQGIANPIAQVLSAALMLEYSFGLADAAESIFHAVDRVLKDGLRTRDIAGDGDRVVSTREMGEAILRNL